MTRSLPILPLRDIVVFPHRIVPLFVGREKSVAALEAAMASDKELFLVAQLDPGEDDPDRDAMYDLGVIATAMQRVKLPDGTVRVLVEGVKRARLVNLVSRDGFMAAEIEEVEEEDAEGAEVQALMRSVIDQFENYAKLNKRLPAETGIQLAEIEQASALADAVASNLSIKVADKQALLGELNPARRLEMVFAFMEGELGVLQVEKKIRSRVKRQMEKTQREYYLNEQLKAIQRELGNESEEGGDELQELAEKIRKTWLGGSIARGTGREFVRTSLGGVRDEAEIRGHRRTYIGSLPGKIISNIKKAGTSNPLFLLDEIDKLGQDFRGDPSSALLEVLDPEQNNKFQDHYLELDYDLSDVMFVTTANSLDMPQPLMDRMEIIRLEGYTEDEKVQIAKRHLIPKQMEAHGLKPEELVFTDEALREMIQHYTREAGVRTLERELAKVARKSLRQILEGKAEKVELTPDNLGEFLGVRKFRYGMGEEEDQIGAVTGLAWTEVGGELLTIEAVTVPGKGQIKTTGKLGEVMQESIQAAMSIVKARAPAYGVKPSIFARKDIHVHLPEGAVPKDGPSAGIGMVTAMISTLSGVAVRRDIAMTGEVTLRGRVLPIGGLKEKLLAALRGGIRTVLIPAENEKDLVELPSTLKEGLEIVPVSHIDEVLARALVEPLI